MSSNHFEGKIIKQAHEWDDHAIVTWDYEGADVPTSEWLLQTGLMACKKIHRDQSIPFTSIFQNCDIRNLVNFSKK
jgi:hypothetical protein